MENLPKKEKINLDDCRLSQMKAGPYAATQVEKAIEKNPSLAELFPPIEVLRAGRTICGVTAMSTGVNFIKKERIIADEGSAKFKVGDFYRFVLDYQGYKPSSPHSGFENGWWVINPNTKDVYHHALVAWAESFDCHVSQINGFKKIEDFGFLLNQDTAAIVSVSNRFVKEITVQNDPECFIEKEGKTFMLILNEDGTFLEREFRPNTHLITVVGIDFEKQEIRYTDSFELRQQKDKTPIRVLSFEIFNRYLMPGKEKALIVSNSAIPENDSFQKISTYIPDEVRTLLSENIALK